MTKIQNIPKNKHVVGTSFLSVAWHIAGLF